MKKYLPLLFLILCISVAAADVPKVFHVIKARVKTQDKDHLTYVLVIGELNYYDSLLNIYKRNPKVFTERIKEMALGIRDSISLYSQIFHVPGEKLILLPKDKETKIALKEIQTIDLLEYYNSEYSGGQVYNYVLSSDSAWVSWEVSEKDYFETVGGSGICGFTMLYFNKPDNTSKKVVKNFEALIRKREEKSMKVPEAEFDKIKERLRKLRIVVLYYCGC